MPIHSTNRTRCEAGERGDVTGEGRARWCFYVLYSTWVRCLRCDTDDVMVMKVSRLI